MKELYLLLDEWDNDRNFAGRELELIASKYNVTVICNSAESELNPKVKYSVYKRPGKPKAVASLMRMMLDRDAWKEFGRVLRETEGRGRKLSEAVRFYINADIFRSYMKKSGFLKDDAIYYSYWYFWKCYAVTHEIDRFPGSRIITRTHEYDLYDYTSPSGYQPFKESMDEKLDAVVFIAEHGREYYLKKYSRGPGDKYKLYHLGTRQPGKAVSGYTESDVMTLVSCSSIISRKRVDRIADALGLIDDIEIKWIHFGTGELEGELRQLCERKLKDKKNINYELKGYVKNEVLHEFYRETSVDAFITASSSEGNPVSVMEAMSYGIPVIAPAVCNFPNMIRECGILVSEACGTDELADAIRQIGDMSQDKIRVLRDNAYKCWDEYFNADKNDKRFVEEVLDRL